MVSSVDLFLDYIPEPPDNTQLSDTINRLSDTIEFLQPLAEKGSISCVYVESLKVTRRHWQNVQHGEAESYKKNLPKSLCELEQLLEQMKIDLDRIIAEDQAVINAIAKELESGDSQIPPFGCPKEVIELMQHFIKRIEGAISCLSK